MLRAVSPILYLSVALSFLCWEPLACAQSDSQTVPKFSPEDIEWFERRVRPILVEQCNSCHSQTVGNLKGGLALDSHQALLAGGDSGPAVVPGNADASLLIEAVRRESYEMPPEKSLSDRQIKTLVEWVSRGAPWPAEAPDGISGGGNWLEKRLQSHWAWQPIKAPSPPHLENDLWSKTDIDRFILHRLRENNLEPAPDSGINALHRRLHFDLTGLIPSVYQDASMGVSTAQISTEAHALDSRAEHSNGDEHLIKDQYAKQVERLLSSPQFGVHWARHWLDLVRYAETLGHEFDYPLRYAWRYRDAVVDTFNNDVGYDQLVVEHIAGDQLSQVRIHPLTGVNQTLALSGFWWLGDSVHAPVDVTGDWATRTDNQIDVFSKAFLGMTVACARCHDHKFDAIGLQDYYGLAGILESSRREYAITDPWEKIAKHQAKTEDQLSVANQQAAEAMRLHEVSADDVRNWMTGYLNYVQGLEPEKRKQEISAANPLWPLNALVVDQDSGSPIPKMLQTARQSESAFLKWESESVVYADFSHGLPSDWEFQGHFDDTHAGFDWFSANLPLPKRPGVFSSAALGHSQHALLRSPTFDVTHQAVSIKMRGKSAQSSVVVSNYFMQEFHQLLFGDLRKPIDQPDDSGWITHRGDLNKYVGHPAFLSIEDIDQAWFEISEVRFANEGPPQRPHPLTLRILQKPRESTDEILGDLASEIAHSFASFAKPDSEEHLTTVRAVLHASARSDLPILPEQKKLQNLAAPLRKLDRATPEPTLLLATRDGTPRDSAIDVRGNPHSLGEIVPRGCFTHLVSTSVAAPASSGRMELAQSLIAPDHPLTARVLVNRIWHHLMGNGLVRSPDNLGVLGGRPTHPELLDYMASEFIRHDWSIKWLVREIVSSRCYQMSSRASETHKKWDADGQLWSHRPVRRMTAEGLRDAMLATANSLDLRVGGPSVPVHLNDQMTGRGRPKLSGPLDGSNRRSVFVEVRRNFLDPFLLAFDFPMPSTSAGKRNQSNVPAQALGLLNDPLVVELSKRWADSTAHLSDPRQRISAMFHVAYGRPARTSEIEQCMQFLPELGKEAWRELAATLFSSKEFYYLN